MHKGQLSYLPHRIVFTFQQSEITCNNSNQHYIRSTTCFIHDPVWEHLNNDNSSTRKHISKCQNKGQKGIEIKTIVLENDPTKKNTNLPWVIP